MVAHTQNKQPGHVSTSLSIRPEGAVATLIVSNTQRLNSLNTEVLTSFISAISALKENTNLRCVIVTGEVLPNGGKGQAAFIGGADISEMSTLPTPDAARTFIRRVHDVCAALRDIPVPVIARVNGHALGAGLLVMAAADLRVASPNALFGMPEVRRGVASTVESAILPGIVGAARARRLLLFGETIDAQTAASWGLLDQVVEGGVTSLDRAVEEWLQIVFQTGPRAVKAQKSLLTVWEQVPMREAVEAGIWEFGKAFEGDGQESEGRRMMCEFLQRNRKRKAML